MAPLAYRDDKILARNLLSHPFFCLTPAEPFFRPDRSSTAPSCRVAVKDGRAFRGHPKGLSLTAASTMARWRYRSGRRPCVADEHVSSSRRSSRLPGSRSRSLYRSPGTPIGKSIDYLDLATIKLPAPAHLSQGHIEPVGRRVFACLRDSPPGGAVRAGWASDDCIHIL